MLQKLAALQQRLGYEFRSTALLLEALTHPSYLQDHPAAGPHNQRLEFLGDSVLQFILTDALFREFTAEREGVLSRRRAVLSQGGFLTQMARDLGLDDALRLSKSEEDTGGRGRASILEDAFEALVGAMYLDSDLATTRARVLAWYGPLAARLAATEDAENPKGRLQELIQPVHGNTALRYEVTATTGPRHAREFAVAVFLNDRQLGTGTGPSKKVAEEIAARTALLTLRQENHGNTK
ncbi:ribonuclease III [Opitutus sp. GAS368]|jgi:ribonuclease-3|uniref:ribonuclease III n=1 Tax=Opitutus sp. GAS368 TaxID=1882749 RepID=UPI00087995FD|nr:ribonuclease III [Opitutus sp. GAS368]SDS66950.1 RNAse III [Opitutus sp. GAS368]